MAERAVAPAAGDPTRWVREAQADVIICDLNDPRRDARESIRALNRDEPRPVVVLAARGASDQIEAALADRVVIECAKDILMQRRRLSEVGAYRMLRCWAMDRSEKLAQVAQQFMRQPRGYGLFRKPIVFPGVRLARTRVVFVPCL
jgi:response regulator NasT